MTNGDRIRSMDDKALASFLICYVDCSTCPVGLSICNNDCTESFIKWLKQEKKGGEPE